MNRLLAAFRAKPNRHALACVTAVFAWLRPRHVTVWACGHPCASVPAPGIAVAVLAAIIVAALWLIFRRLRKEGFGGIPTAYWGAVT